MKAKYIVKTFAIIAAISNIQAVRLLAFTRKTKITPDVHISDKIKPTPIIAGSNMNSNETNSNVNPEETDQNTKPTDNEFTYSLDQTKPKINKKLLYLGTAIGGASLIALVATLAAKYIHGKSRPKLQNSLTPAEPSGQSSTLGTYDRPIDAPITPQPITRQSEKELESETNVKPQAEPAAIKSGISQEKPADSGTAKLEHHQPQDTSGSSQITQPDTHTEQSNDKLSGLQEQVYALVPDKHIVQLATETIPIERIQLTKNIFKTQSNGDGFCYFVSMMHMLSNSQEIMQALLTQCDTLINALNKNIKKQTKINLIIIRAFLNEIIKCKLGFSAQVDVRSYQKHYMNNAGTSVGGDPNDVMLDMMQLLHFNWILDLDYGNDATSNGTPSYIFNDFLEQGITGSQPRFFLKQKQRFGETMKPDEPWIQNGTTYYRLISSTFGVPGHYKCLTGTTLQDSFFPGKQRLISATELRNSYIQNAVGEPCSYITSVYEISDRPPPGTDTLDMDAASRYSAQCPNPTVAQGAFHPIKLKKSDDHETQKETIDSIRVEILKSLRPFGCAAGFIDWLIHEISPGILDTIHEALELQMNLPGQEVKSNQRIATLAFLIQESRKALSTQSLMRIPPGLEPLFDQTKSDILKTIKDIKWLVPGLPIWPYATDNNAQLLSGINKQIKSPETAMPITNNASPYDKFPRYIFNVCNPTDNLPSELGSSEWPKSIIDPGKIKDTRFILVGKILSSAPEIYEYVPYNFDKNPIKFQEANGSQACYIYKNVNFG
ncbi:MAG: hypothetical protein NkDv07_0355 [Candidatus Improbicoccus devescovinae]|nr:MAG: hypothetical protein NkDv07_0355 [Candidatus Improbicoccus devescovinae]